MYDDQRPVYLHFLDRELGASVDFHVTARSVEKLLKLLALTCSATFYCGISVIWENPALDTDCRRFMVLLGETDVLDAVSYSGTVEEFYESRQRLYAHDAERYPLYFTGGPDGLRTIRATLHKPQDTTSALLGDLEAWTAGPRPHTDSRSTTDTALRVAERALRARADEAITYSFFHPFLLRAGGQATRRGRAPSADIAGVLPALPRLRRGRHRHRRQGTAVLRRAARHELSPVRRAAALPPRRGGGSVVAGAAAVAGAAGVLGSVPRRAPGRRGLRPRHDGADHSDGDASPTGAGGTPGFAVRRADQDREPHQTGSPRRRDAVPVA